MKAIKYLKSTGDIIGHLELIGEYDLSVYITDTIGCIEADINPNDTTIYVVDGKLTTRPAKPTIYHSWDGHTWIANNKYLENDIRIKRNELLADSDWIVTKSIEIGDEVPQDWKTYRQALRDITNQTGFPLDVAWPTKPS